MINKKINNSVWSLQDLPNLDGKNVIITGSNNGLGFESTKIFVNAGAHVIMACRNLEKTNKKIIDLDLENSRGSVEFMELDLANLKSIHSISEKINEKFSHIEVLVNNAGIMTVPYKKYTETMDGFEIHLGINHLGHFALTGLLIDKILSSKNGRIVTVTSSGHKRSKINFDDIQGKNDLNHAYGNSKLCNLLFTYELNRRLQSLGANAIAVACHPGLAKTNLPYNGPSIVHTKPSKIMRIVYKSAQSSKMGSLPIVYAATGININGGDYIGPSKFYEMRGLPKKVRSSKSSYDQGIAKRIWSISEKLTGVSYLN